MRTSTHNISEQLFLPGRLGDLNRILKTHPRANPRMVAALAPFGLDVVPAPAPVTADSSLKEKLDFVREAELGSEAMFTALVTALLPIELDSGPKCFLL